MNYWIKPGTPLAHRSYHGLKVHFLGITRHGVGFRRFKLEIAADQPGAGDRITIGEQAVTTVNPHQKSL